MVKGRQHGVLHLVVPAAIAAGTLLTWHELQLEFDEPVLLAKIFGPEIPGLLIIEFTVHQHGVIDDATTWVAFAEAAAAPLVYCRCRVRFSSPDRGSPRG